MARTGIYFTDVKRAREELIAAGLHPSIDAVRTALGNTGSKTTIHKYLREIEMEQGASQRVASDAILALVAQLSDRLNQEATAELEEVRARANEQRAIDEQARADLEAQLAAARQSQSEMSQRLEVRERELEGLRNQLAAESSDRRTAEQQVADLNLRLADAERHQASLEEKHKHARDALEHFRVASKEQRDQEQHRHEHQVQGLQAELRQERLTVSVKQEELTRLNTEAAGLATELRAVKQNLHIERETNRGLRKTIDELNGNQARLAVLDAQFKESTTRLAAAEAEITRVNSACEDLRRENSSLEAALLQAISSSALEARLAKLNKAVFGEDPDVSRDLGTTE